MSEFELISIDTATPQLRAPRTTDIGVLVSPRKDPGVYTYQYLTGSTQSLSSIIPESLAVGDLVNVSALNSTSAKCNATWKCTSLSASLPSGAVAGIVTGNANGALYLLNSAATYYKFELVGEKNVLAFGALGDGITDDLAAIEAAIQADSGSVNVCFPEGTFLISSTLAITKNYVILKGASDNTSSIRNGSTTANCIEFAPEDPGAGSGNTLYGCGIVDLRISRADNTATAGYALQITRGVGFLARGLYIEQHANGIRLIGGQDSTFERLFIYGRYDSATPIAGSSLFRTEPALLDDASYQPLWQTFVSTFEFGGTQSVEHVIDLHGCDGLNFANGYVNYGTTSLVRLYPENQTISPLNFANVYFDGVAVDEGVDYGLYVPTGTSEFIGNVTFGSGCFLGNNSVSPVYIRRDCAIEFIGATILGWQADPTLAEYAIDVEGGAATAVQLVGCRIGASRGGVRIDDASSVLISGNRFLSIVGASKYAIHLLGTIERVSINGNSLFTSGGAAEFQNDATISNEFTYAANATTDASSKLNGVRPGNNANTDTSALDWYEETTFTPSLRFGSGTTGITYGAQEGHLTRIGNRVFFSIRVVLTSKGSSTGEARVSGMTYNALAGNVTFPASIRLNAMDAAVPTEGLTGDVLGADIRFTYLLTGSQATLQDTHFTNTSAVTINGAYIVA